ncbi:hypothetical protein CH330_04740 [candidate division WOR-3 bacterium JGI_Cruoil_03_51_56]|uniref:Uncharacterized protein n=1 Tax=candidate division WOR-3 bacterium JGI_Cruoil_03_51_56 TaxID=1973747 RepID=A0A235BUC4_UNCW3|nr:MAG: hypothetical protein CH330_04740 [candidate division WOR-3 bacterium JGI_Cruoil_03_51_56]
MLKGKLKDTQGYIETWGTIKALIEVWHEGKDLVIKGECTDIVELYTWLLPTIQNAHPKKDLLLGPIIFSETEQERNRLMHRVRKYFEKNSYRMEKVTPSRKVQL